MQNLPQARNTDIVVQTLGNETLIYDLKTHKAYNLNETSTAVYQACDGKTSFDDLKRRHKLTDDIIFLTLDQLEKENLVESGSFVSFFDGLSRREVIRKVGLASLITLPVIASLVAPTAAMAASAGRCSGGLSECSGNCFNLETDSNNCGACGNVCRNGQTCQQSFCRCTSTQVNCSGTCVNYLSDVNNCGGCLNRCGVGQSCVNGSCVCAGTQTNCSGTCVNLESDSNNCGACGNVCRNGQFCQQSFCGCLSTQVNCSGTCVNYLSDVNNCGGCGTVCATGQSCVSGSCV